MLPDWSREPVPVSPGRARRGARRKLREVAEILGASSRSFPEFSEVADYPGASPSATLGRGQNLRTHNHENHQMSSLHDPLNRILFDRLFRNVRLLSKRQR